LLTKGFNEQNNVSTMVILAFFFPFSFLVFALALVLLVVCLLEFLRADVVWFLFAFASSKKILRDNQF